MVGSTPTRFRQILDDSIAFVGSNPFKVSSGPAVLFPSCSQIFDKLFNINVRGTLFTVQKALPLLNDGDSMTLNGSVASVKGTAAFGVYAASKAAIRSFV